MWKSRNSIRLKYLIGLQLWNTGGDDDGDDMDINGTSESIRGNVRTSSTEGLGYCELKRHKQAKLQRLHNPSPKVR
jgi:hypothetical protein